MRKLVTILLTLLATATLAIASVQAQTFASSSAKFFIYLPSLARYSFTTPATASTVILG